MADYSFTTALMADKYNLDPTILRRMVQTESAGNPNAVSPKGAAGLMQLMPGTAKELGVDPNDPISNLDGGARYFRQQLDHFGNDTNKALAAYNFGPGHVARGDALPTETQNYIQKVNGPQQTATPFSDAMHSFDAGAQEAPSISGFIGNVGKSAMNFGEGIANTIAHPIDTVMGVGKLAAGGAEKLGDLAGVKPLDNLVGDQRPVADKVGEFYKNRYGGLDNIKKTAYEDPVGLAAELSTLLGIGGAALPGKIGRIASVAGEITNPLNAVVKPLSAVGEIAAETMMGNALKPSLRLRQEFEMNPRQFGRAALNEDKVIVSDKSLKNIQGSRSEVAGGKNALYDEAQAAGRTADPKTIHDKMAELFDTKGTGKQLFPDKDINAVQETMANWKDRNSHRVFYGQQQGAPQINQAWTPIQDLKGLEEAKQGTYRSLKNAYRQGLGERPGSVEAERMAASGAKTALEDATTGLTHDGLDLKGLNQRDKVLHAIEEAISERLTNNGSPSVGLDIAMGALGGPLKGIPAIALHRLLANPKAASFFARQIDGLAGATDAVRRLTPAEVLQRALR